MAWKQPGDNQREAPRRSSPRASGGARPWRRWRQRWSTRPRERGPFYAVAAGIAALLWLATGFFQIDDGEQGVLQRFGAFAGLRGSGAGWHLPWPVETVTAVNLGRLNSADFQSRMLTQEGMLVNVTASIQYQYTDARAALFAARDPDSLVRELGEAATREAIGQRRIAELMGGAARAALTAALRIGVQRALDTLGVGLRVRAVDLTDVQVPEPVLAAQRELVQAGVERERIAREAQGYAAELVPAAQGLAQRQRLEAQAYKLQVVGTAEGEAARFGPIAAAYARAPAVTRSRLYIETMEAILARAHKLIIDGSGRGRTLVVPLDKLTDAGVLKAAGVTGIVPAGAAASAVPGAAATPASATPGAAAAGATVPAVRDERGRERGERR